MRKPDFTSLMNYTTRYFKYRNLVKIFGSCHPVYFDTIFSCYNKSMNELELYIHKGNFDSTFKLSRHITNYDFFNDIKINNRLKKFQRKYPLLVKSFIAAAESKRERGVFGIDVNRIKLLINLPMMKYYDITYEEEIKIKVGAISDILGSKPRYKVVTSLEGELKLPYEKINSIIFDSEIIIGRMTTSNFYLDYPNQRFLYGEGMEINHPEIRSVCKDALIKQNNEFPEGVTKKQIESGVYTGIDFIRGGGQNCTHIFYPATEFFIKRQKQKTNEGLISK